jgi:hypothetical protein
VIYETFPETTCEMYTDSEGFTPVTIITVISELYKRIIKNIKVPCTGPELSNIYLGYFFMDPKDIRGLSLGAVWNFLRRTGFS